MVGWREVGVAGTRENRGRMRVPWLILAACGTAAVLMTIVAGLFWFERPTRLTVAVSEHDTDAIAVLNAAARHVKFDRRTIRLTVLRLPDEAAASAALDRGVAELAVVRPDIALPAAGQTVIILRRRGAVIVAPASADLHTPSDLSGHTVGLVGPAGGNRGLLDAILTQYDVPKTAVTVVPLPSAEVAAAIKAKRVDAVATVDVVTGEAVRGIVRQIAEAGGGAPIFLPVAEAAAIAQRTPVYEKIEVLRGAFGGAAPRPDDDFDTLGVAERLVAHESVAQGPIADLTRFFLTERLSIAGDAPAAMLIEAPATDKGASVPVHPGAAAYIDDEEETFFDRYSDFIYIGAMLIGVLASGFTAVLGRINQRKAAALESALTRVLDLLAVARAAPSTALLDEVQSEADGLLSAAVESAAVADERRLAALGLALNQLHGAVRERRRALAEGAAPTADLVRPAARSGAPAPTLT